MSIILEAAQFAANAHAEQFRKHFRNRPYFYHVAAVAGRVAEWGSETEVAAAYLHDTLEDTNTTQAILEAEFGPEVANLVVELTSRSKQIGYIGTRVERKRVDCDYLAKASRSAQQIKLVDRACNLEDFLAVKDQAVFTLKYAKESVELLKAIGHADQFLAVYVDGLIQQAFEEFSG